MGERFAIREYAFETKAEWEEAKREEESIAYIREKMDLGNPETVEKLYKKLIEKRNFITPVGIDFLKELRNFLLRAGRTEEKIPPIYITLPVRKGGVVPGEQSKYKQQARQYQEKLRTTRMMVVFLVIIVIAMFLITMFGPNTPLADAEERIQDRYASWEQELTEREKEIREREQELGITPIP